MIDPLAHLRSLAATDPAKWGPVLKEHERQLLEGPRQATAIIRTPPLWRQALNFAHALAKHVRAGLPQTPSRLRKTRLKTCKACPHFLPENERCGVCGCFLATKISWQLATCPKGKW
jgi:hypothetical protein